MARESTFPIQNLLIDKRSTPDIVTISAILSPDRPSGASRIQHPDDQETLSRAQIRGCPFDSARIRVDRVSLVGRTRRSPLSASWYPVSS